MVASDVHFDFKKSLTKANGQKIEQLFPKIPSLSLGVCGFCEPGFVKAESGDEDEGSVCELITHKDFHSSHPNDLDCKLTNQKKSHHPRVNLKDRERDYGCERITRKEFYSTDSNDEGGKILKRKKYYYRRINLKHRQKGSVFRNIHLKACIWNKRSSTVHLIRCKRKYKLLCELSDAKFSSACSLSHTQSTQLSTKTSVLKVPKSHVHHERKYKIISELSDVKSASCPSHAQSARDFNKISIGRGWLRDTLFDFYFRKIWDDSPERKRDGCAYFSSLWFYMYTIDHKRKKVVSWMQREGIFSKRYVFCPIVLWSHWYLLIFCNLGESLKSKTRRPCMLLLDSLHALNPLRLEPLIRSLVLDLYEAEGRHGNRNLIGKIPLLIPKVPQQRNGDECGYFALFYAKLFLECAPKSFDVFEAYPYFMEEDWFAEEEVEEFYGRLDALGTDSGAE